MGRLEFAQILMIFYIAPSCVQNFVSCEGSPNVTLVKHNNDVWCVAQGEAATSALAWTSRSRGLQRGVSYFIGNKSALDCNFMKPESCTGWEGLAVTASLEHDVPPLFDYRWNDLPLIQTNGEREFHDHNIVSLPKDKEYWNVTVSVTAESIADIRLCEGRDPLNSACYVILLGGFPGQDGRCVIRRSVSGADSEGNHVGTVDPPVYGNNTRLVTSDKWVHVTISKEHQELKLKLAGEDVPFLKYKDEEPLHPGFLIVDSRNADTAYFRIQNYTFVVVNSTVLQRHPLHDQVVYSIGRLRSPWFRPRSKQLCVSLHYYTHTRESTTVQLYVDYQGRRGSTFVQNLEPSEGTWKEKRIVYRLDEVWENGIRITIFASGDGFFALGSVRECNALGDVQVYKVTSPPGVDVSCHPLKYSSSVLTLKDPDPNFTGCVANCLLSCDRSPFNEITRCDRGIVFCQPTREGSSCFCNPGYFGSGCA